MMPGIDHTSNAGPNGAKRIAIYAMDKGTRLASPASQYAYYPHIVIENADQSRLALA